MKSTQVDLNQDVEQQARKCVQMTNLAKNLAELIKKQTEEKVVNFGEVFVYNEVYLCKVPSGEYINNTGRSVTTINGFKNEKVKKAECFAHFTYQKSNKELLVVPIHGIGYKLCNPEIATTVLRENDEFPFCADNLSQYTIDAFKAEHDCNEFCTALRLKKL
eukprot:gene18440-20289_t